MGLCPKLLTRMNALGLHTNSVPILQVREPRHKEESGYAGIPQSCRCLWPRQPEFHAAGTLTHRAWHVVGAQQTHSVINDCLAGKGRMMEKSYSHRPGPPDGWGCRCSSWTISWFGQGRNQSPGSREPLAATEVSLARGRGRRRKVLTILCFSQCWRPSNPNCPGRRWHPRSQYCGQFLAAGPLEVSPCTEIETLLVWGSAGGLPGGTRPGTAT